MKGLIRFMACWLLLGPVVLPAPAAFTSLYVFGDGASTTTNNPFAGPSYYGLRRSNGRVWVEVLAQRQGLNYESNKNWSYYGHYSANLVTNVNSFAAPTNANTALFIVWVNDADFVNDMGKIYPSTNIVTWSNAISLSLNNHFKAITNLYAKGARTVILPNAVDITKIPQYNLTTSAALKSFVRQRVMDFNAAFATTLVSRIKTNCPGLTVYVPDIFTLLDNILVRSADYGMTNALYNGQSIDVLEDPALADKSLNGRGTNYIFWDTTDPTAKAHAVIADFVQQLLSPVRINSITHLSGGNRLEMVNLPIGRAGFVEGSAGFSGWTNVAGIASTNTTQTIFLPAPANGPPGFYRLRFPFAWAWP